MNKQRQGFRISEPCRFLVAAVSFMLRDLHR